MSASESESLSSKLRSIDVALDNFNSRLQDSFSSQISAIRNKVENVNSRLVSAIVKGGTPQLILDLRVVLEEIKGIIQKDILQNITQLFNEKLKELQGLISRVKGVSNDQSNTQRPATAQRQVLTQPGSSGLASDLSRPTGDKDREIASLREEINRLYNLTEREPRFQAFWILRDAYPSSLHITKVARTLNATPGEVLENLKIFQRLGLIEIKEGEARATKLIRPNNPGTQVT